MRSVVVLFISNFLLRLIPIIDNKIFILADTDNAAMPSGGKLYTINYKSRQDQAQINANGGDTAKHAIT